MSDLSQQELMAKLGEQVAFWQDALRLKDWIIRAEFWPHHALDSSVCKAIIRRNQKTVVIAFRYPSDIAAVEHDWLPGEAADYDISIVHELLHVLLHDMESKVEWAEEQVCNILSRMLVSLYRTGAPNSLGAPESPQATSVSKDETSGHYL